MFAGSDQGQCCSFCFCSGSALRRSPARLPLAPVQAVDLIAGLSTLAEPLAAGDRYLLFGSDQEQMKAQFLKFFSAADWEANQRMQVRSLWKACLNGMPIVWAGLSSYGEHHRGSEFSQKVIQQPGTLRPQRRGKDSRHFVQMCCRQRWRTWFRTLGPPGCKHPSAWRILQNAMSGRSCVRCVCCTPGPAELCTSLMTCCPLSADALAHYRAVLPCPCSGE